MKLLNPLLWHNDTGYLFLDTDNNSLSSIKKPVSRDQYLVSYPRNTFHNFIRFYDTLGVWESLFSFTTIYPEVVERHHNFAYYEAAPRTMYPQRRVFPVPVHRTLSSLGAVTGLGVFWAVELKRNAHAPFESVQQVLIIQFNSETRH